MGKVDVLVVGAGIMGVASAYHILRNNPGKTVLLVDRYGAAGQGNTGRSNAMFRNTFSSRDNQILANSAIDFYLHVQNDMKEDIGLQEIGYLWLMSEEQLSESETFLAGMERNGIGLQRFESQELAVHLPGMSLDGNGGAQASLLGLPKIAAGVFGPKCGRLDPDKLVRFYSSKFKEMGGRLAFNTEAERIVLGPQERLGIEGEPFVWQDWRVDGIELSGKINDTVMPDTLVLACGAWGNELLGPIGIDGHVRAKKRQLFSVQATGNRSLDALLRTRSFNPLGLVPMVILPKSGVHFKPVSEEDCFWVACEDDINRPYIDMPKHDVGEYLAEPLYYERSMKPVLTGYFPAFENAAIKAMWAGLYSYNTVDFLPFTFRENNLIVVGGDSGSGIMKGDSLGRIADALYRDQNEVILYGDSPYQVSKLSFNRRDVEREEWTL